MNEQTARRIAKNLDWLYFAIILHAFVMLANSFSEALVAASKCANESTED